MLRRATEYIKAEISSIRNGRIFVFLACLGLASFLWFINALDKQYTDHISVPIRYRNIPKDKELVGKLPTKFDLTVNANGYTLLQHKLSFALVPVYIDVNELTNNYLENIFLSKYSI
jgi:hypothetical protein